MSQQNRKRQHQHVKVEEEEDNDNRSIAGSEWTMDLEEEENAISNENGNELRELKLKMAALEVQKAFISRGNAFKLIIFRQKMKH